MESPSRIIVTPDTILKSVLVQLLINNSRKSRSINLNSIHVGDKHVRIESFHYNIYYEIDIDSLRKDESNRVDISFAATEKNEQILKSINRGNGDINIIVTPSSYIISNGHRECKIGKITPTLSSTTIDKFLNLNEDQVLPGIRNISSRNELSLTGKEKKVILGIYGGKLESIIIPGQCEHFLSPDKVEQTLMMDKLLVKTFGFLKLETPGFSLTIHEANGSLWLLTKGKLVNNVNYKVLEKLIVI